MSLTAWILLILLVVYIPLWLWVFKSPKAVKYGLEKYGPCVKINTRWGTKLMRILGRFHRFWRAYGVLSQILAFILMVEIVYIMVVGIINLPSSITSGGLGIEYALAIPGINPLLPFWYTLIALIVAMVLHELAHGMQTVSNKMRVKHTGILHCVVPLGAFVEPDQEDVDKSSRRVRLDLYSAGIATNFIVGAIAFVLFANVMLGGISSPYADSAAIYYETGDSPAYEAGLPAGAIILTVDGEDFTYSTDLNASYSWSPGEVVTVVYLLDDGQHTASFRWGLYVESVVDGSPADDVLKAGWILTSFTYEGTVYEMYSANLLTTFMNMTAPGDTVTIAYISADGSTSGTTDLTLGTKGDVGYIGIHTTTSGMSFITPTVLLETATNPFYGASSLSEYATGALTYIALPFEGFCPVPASVQWWYGEQTWGFWEIAELLYWIFWLDIMLGVSNAIPAYPFDGGVIF
ncbi:MAG: site-2 protease family protein, partial [Candidatus Methanomethylophilus sp.]|nr:site-2 protease family protein [Methanomethylophilus sp.]